MNVISLGWGVQSWTLAAMSALGELEPAIAIHSDTQREREETYAFAAKWTPWLEGRGVRVVTVTASDNAHRLYPESTNVFMPMFTINGGMMRRQCTDRWKIRPFVKEARRIANGQPVSVWLGISWDEMHRAKPRQEAGMKNRWPLIEKRMTRAMCEEWLMRNGLEIPVKSACWSCPLHSTEAWRALGDADRQRAIALDEQLRDALPDSQIYLSRKLKPLAQVFDGIDAQVEMELDDSCESGHCFV